jgi:hypothetical protein
MCKSTAVRRYLPTNWLLPLKEYCGMSQLCKVASLSLRLPTGRLERPRGAIHLRSVAPSTRPRPSQLEAIVRWKAFLTARPEVSARPPGRETAAPRLRCPNRGWLKKRLNYSSVIIATFIAAPSSAPGSVLVPGPQANTSTNHIGLT